MAEREQREPGRDQIGQRRRPDPGALAEDIAQTRTILTEIGLVQ